MKFKPKGRKIYRKKSKFERIQAFKSNTSAVLGTLLAACVLIFVGYSAGGPLIRFLQESQILAVPNEVEETLPPTEATDASQEDPALAGSPRRYSGRPVSGGSQAVRRFPRKKGNHHHRIHLRR